MLDVFQWTQLITALCSLLTISARIYCQITAMRQIVIVKLLWSQFNQIMVIMTCGFERQILLLYQSNKRPINPQLQDWSFQAAWYLWWWGGRLWGSSRLWRSPAWWQVRMKRLAIRQGEYFVETSWEKKAFLTVNERLKYLFFYL